MKKIIQMINSSNEKKIVQKKKNSSNEKKNWNELKYSFKWKKIVQIKNKQTTNSNKIVKNI